MRLQTESFRPPKIQEKRRGLRVNSRITVILEWQGTAGEKLRAEGFTRVVGHYGCLVVFPQGLGKDQHVQVTNTATDQANEAVVVWQGKKGGDGWELGIELTRPPMGFWGLEI